MEKKTLVADPHAYSFFVNRNFDCVCRQFAFGSDSLSSFLICND